MLSFQYYMFTMENKVIISIFWDYHKIQLSFTLFPLVLMYSSTNIRLFGTFNDVNLFVTYMYANRNVLEIRFLLRQLFTLIRLTMTFILHCFKKSDLMPIKESSAGDFCSISWTVVKYKLFFAFSLYKLFRKR